MNFVEPIRDRKKIAQIKKIYCGDKSVSGICCCLWWGSTRHCASQTCCNCKSITFWMSRGESREDSGSRSASGANVRRWWSTPASEKHKGEHRRSAGTSWAKPEEVNQAQALYSFFLAQVTIFKNKYPPNIDLFNSLKRSSTTFFVSALLRSETGQLVNSI